MKDMMKDFYGSEPNIQPFVKLRKSKRTIEELINPPQTMVKDVPATPVETLYGDVGTLLLSPTVHDLWKGTSSGATGASSSLFGSALPKAPAAPKAPAIPKPPKEDVNPFNAYPKNVSTYEGPKSTLQTIAQAPKHLFENANTLRSQNYGESPKKLLQNAGGHIKAAFNEPIRHSVNTVGKGIKRLATEYIPQG